MTDKDRLKALADVLNATTAFQHKEDAEALIDLAKDYPLTKGISTRLDQIGDFHVVKVKTTVAFKNIGEGFEITINSSGVITRS